MKTVFMISPYNADVLYFEKKKNTEYLCKKYNINFVRAEDISTGRSLNANETAILLHNCDYAIADLSYERPSCYYEVGYLQALNKPVYLICKSDSVLHQALGIQDTLTYGNLYEYVELIEKILIKAVDLCRTSRNTRDFLMAS